MRNYYIILMILVGLSCGNESVKEANEIDSSEQKTTPETKSSTTMDAPRIYCNIDSRQWQGGAVNGSLIKENELEIVIVDITGVAPIKNNVDFTTMFNLSMRNFKGLGTYDKDISFSIKKLYREKPGMMEDQTSEGQIKVTKWDPETGTISGEFTTVIPTKSKSKHFIDDGHFSDVVLKVVNLH